MKALFLLLVTCLRGLASDVMVSWAPDPGAAGFNVYYGAFPGTYTNEINAGPGLSARVAGLMPGAKYFFAATAYDDSGIETDFSDEATYRVPLARPVIARPKVEIFVTTFVLEETSNPAVAGNWSAVDRQAVFFTRPFDPRVPAKFYRVKQTGPWPVIAATLTL